MLSQTEHIPTRSESAVGTLFFLRMAQMTSLLRNLKHTKYLAFSFEDPKTRSKPRLIITSYMFIRLVFSEARVKSYDLGKERVLTSKA